MKTLRDFLAEASFTYTNKFAHLGTEREPSKETKKIMETILKTIPKDYGFPKFEIVYGGSPYDGISCTMKEGKDWVRVSYRQAVMGSDDLRPASVEIKTSSDKAFKSFFFLKGPYSLNAEFPTTSDLGKIAKQLQHAIETNL